MNGGGIRGGKIYPAGTTITRRDILEEMPFGNRLIHLDITGKTSAPHWKTDFQFCRRRPAASPRFPA